MPNKRRSNETAAKAVDKVDLDDEDIDEDEAFNSDDERRWGHFFDTSSKKSSKKMASDNDQDSQSSSDDNGDDDGILSNDDDSADGDDGQYMLELLENLDDKNKKKSAELTSGRHYSTPESEFSASVVQGTHLTMEQLMSGITNTKGFSCLAKSIATISGGSNKLTTAKTPASRIMSERAMRKVQYEEQSKNVSLWTEAIQENRKAETLDFRCKERMCVTREGLVSTFTPATDFEKEIEKALEAAGAATEEDIQRKEQASVFGGNGELYDDDLGAATLTLQEYKRRHGELAKMRALMFYEEIKMHHINKIKSKKYRKIRKKQRHNTKQKELEAQLDDNPELLKELQEKEEMERMKERMTLAHKNTSKWAKQQLGRKGKIDVETRRALSEQIRIGDELRRKMRSVYDDDNDEEEEDDSNLISQARLILQETSDDFASNQDAEENHENSKATGVFKMAFMQRGLQLQRERAKQEARKLLEELERNLTDDDDNNNSTDNDEKLKQMQPYIERKQTAVSTTEAAKIVSVGKLVANTLQFGKYNALETSGNINIGGEDCSISLRTPNDEKITKACAPIASHSNHSEENDPRKKAGPSANASINIVDSSSINPWMSSKVKKSSTKRKRNDIIVDVKEAAFALSSDYSPINDETTTKLNTSNSFPDSKISISDDNGKTGMMMTVHLTQEQLVRRAFAAPTDAELLEELEQEKNALQDNSKKRKDDGMKVAQGWGSWAGDGVELKTTNINKKFPKHLQPPPPKKTVDAKKTKETKKTVILNDRRIKKSLKFQIPHIPYPYRSREEYEKAMAGAIGQEWNVSGAVKSMTRSEIQTTKGRIIAPISKKAKIKRAPAKF